MAVYPSNMDPIGVKLWEKTRFRRFPTCRRPNNLFGDFLFLQRFFQESCVLEELGLFERH